MFIRTDNPGVWGEGEAKRTNKRGENVSGHQTGDYSRHGQTSPRLAGVTEDSRFRVIYQIYLRELILSAGGRDFRRR